MKIEKLGKIGIGVGIAVGVMILFMLSLTIPDMIERINPNYNTPRFEQTSEIEDVNAEFLMEKFTQTESYDVFVQRYPDHVENLYADKGGGNLHLMAVNTDSNNVLNLRFNWSINRELVIDIDAECVIGNSLDRAEIRARQSAVPDFLKKTDCLD